MASQSMPTISELITTSGKADPRSRELLLAHVLAKPHEWVLAHPAAPMRPATAARYRRLLRRLERGEPLAYLLGKAWFYGRPFTVNRNVLIPRPETETMIELALQHLQAAPSPSHGEGEKKKWGTPPPFSPSLEGEREGEGSSPVVIDIGTGSGCIAVTLAAEIPHARIIATDVSRIALRIARANARRHGIADRIAFLRGNLLEPIGKSLRARRKPSAAISAHHWARLLRRLAPRNDTELLMLANLPYLTTAEWRALPRSIRDYEPRQALDGGPDGLTHFRELFVQLRTIAGGDVTPPLRPLTAFLEIDPRRKRTLTALVRKTLPDWRASWHRDLARRWRVLELTAWRSS